MGISDDIRAKKHRRKNQPEEIIPVEDNTLSKEDVSDIIEPLPDTYEDHIDIHDTKPFFEPEKPAAAKNSKPKSVWLIILLVLLVLALIGAAVYQNYDVIQRKLFKTNDAAAPSETKVVDSTPTDESQTATDTSTQAITVQPEATQPVTQPVTTDKSFTIRVSNGNGVRGSADKVRDTLRAGGFNVVSVGNATRYTYQSTIIYHKAGKEAAANLVKDALSARTVSVEASSTLSTYDILVIVGAK